MNRDQIKKETYEGRVNGLEGKGRERKSSWGGVEDILNKR